MLTGTDIVKKFLKSSDLIEINGYKYIHYFNDGTLHLNPIAYQKDDLKFIMIFPDNVENVEFTKYAMIFRTPEEIEVHTYVLERQSMES